MKKIMKTMNKTTIILIMLLSIELLAHTPKFTPTESLWMKSGPVGIMVLHVKLGEYVKKGQPIYSLNSDLQKVDLRYYKKEAQFYNGVINNIGLITQTGIISKKIYDELMQDYKIALANIEKTKAEIDDLTYCAPFDGTVTAIYVYDGSGVSDNTDMVQITKGHVKVNTAHRKATICNRKEGILSKLYVKEGEHVKKGQVLFQPKLKQLEAQLKIDLAKANNLLENLRCHSKLKAKSVPFLDYQQAGINALNAVKDVDKDIITLKQEIMRAPFNGTVTKIWVHENQGFPHDKPVVEIIADE
jgi:multidrug efflux pump subunit AcrA (membrane-fusion protein)